MHLNDGLVNVGVFPEHVQVIRSNIGHKSFEKCRDVQNEPISRKSWGYPLGRIVQTPPCFLKTEDYILNIYCISSIDLIYLKVYIYILFVFYVL
jgi:hypothetical protein